MSIGFCRAPLTSLAKGASQPLALLAVSAALAAPICGAFELPGKGHEEQWRASLNDTPIAPAAATSAFEPPAFVAYVAWSPDWQYLPFVLLLACPLLHLFHGHGGHGKHGRHEKDEGRR